VAKPGTLHATPQLYERRARGESLRSLAADFGVSKTAMSVHFSGLASLGSKQPSASVS
jgi:hypothetical protein